jgi:hypothetical protein
VDGAGAARRLSFGGINTIDTGDGGTVSSSWGRGCSLRIRAASTTTCRTAENAAARRIGEARRDRLLRFLVRPIL